MANKICMAQGLVNERELRTMCKCLLINGAVQKVLLET